MLILSETHHSGWDERGCGAGCSLPLTRNSYATPRRGRTWADLISFCCVTELAAAVTNNGGLGVIGGVGYTPEFLREAIQEVRCAVNSHCRTVALLTPMLVQLKGFLHDKSAPFGVDLLLPKVGDGARATNKDYTEGQLPALIDIIIEEKAALFVCAVGVPPKFVVEKLHAAGIPVMNMIGAPKHVPKALAVGCDIICAQGGEGGGHTGEVATSILIPKVVDICKGKASPLTGRPVAVVAAGGIYDGRGLAMALSLGADAVWVGTRFVASRSVVERTAVTPSTSSRPRPA